LKRLILLTLAVAVLLVCGLVGWRAWSAFRPSPLPPVERFRAGCPDPNAAAKIHVDYPGPTEDQTVGDLAAMADAVLIVARETNRTARVERSDSGLPLTIYEFVVRESVKGNDSTGEVVGIARLGDRDQHEDGFPRPGLGEQFLVFLKWVPDLKAYEHLYGPETFRIVNGEVQPMSRVFRHLSGRKLGDLLPKLRKAVRGS